MNQILIDAAIVQQALDALEKVSARRVIMGSTGDYRSGQIDALAAIYEDVAPAEDALRQAVEQAEKVEPAIGCTCSVCGEWQRWTPSGMVCKNGHGGVAGINHKLFAAPPAQPANGA